MPPRTPEEWNKEFEEYKEFPEYKITNREMDIEGFKAIYYPEWAHRMVARSIGTIFFFPLTYFWARGYLKNRMKLTLLGLFATGGLQGCIGWWMVKSGLVPKTDKNNREVDKAPRVSPYRLATHAGFAYTLFSVCLWQSLHLLRRPQESVITLKNMAEHNVLRKNIMRLGYLFIPVVLLTGFFTAGICGGYSCNTFPFVGTSWFISKKHLNRDIPTWKNFTENKLIVQVTHRTLASLFVLAGTVQFGRMLMLKNLTTAARFGCGGIIIALWMQASIGVASIWQNIPTHLANSHQIGAVSILSSVIFCMHTCRRVDPRHIRNLMGKFKVENPEGYK